MFFCETSIQDFISCLAGTVLLYKIYNSKLVNPKQFSSIFEFKAKLLYIISKFTARQNISI